MLTTRIQQIKYIQGINQWKGSSIHSSLLLMVEASIKYDRKWEFSLKCFEGKDARGCVLVSDGKLGPEMEDTINEV